jgi:hypothetical protein
MAMVNIDIGGAAYQEKSEATVPSPTGVVV